MSLNINNIFLINIAHDLLCLQLPPLLGKLLLLLSNHGPVQTTCLRAQYEGVFVVVGLGDAQSADYTEDTVFLTMQGVAF